MSASNTYFEMQTNTAGPGELVVMLYKGAARFLVSAIAAVEARDVQTASNKLVPRSLSLASTRTDVTPSVSLLA